MDNSESKVIRIVNLDKDTTNGELKELLKERVNLRGKIERTHIRTNSRLNLVFAYIIFELQCDAKQSAEILNGAYYKERQLDVAEVTPYGTYKKYLQSPRGNLPKFRLERGFGEFRRELDAKISETSTKNLVADPRSSRQLRSNLFVNIPENLFKPGSRHRMHFVNNSAIGEGVWPA
ncbi:uncharacterized protein [Leptinotarsa decemlineata]|uniref:uncharacterized protein n=1 Tax=Leptinotarsa decemlineata TaxID=7539 RepID=UPI003D30B17C